MARTPFKLVNLNESFGSPAAKRAKTVDWAKCFICQDVKSEGLRNPSNAARLVQEDAYVSLAKNMQRFEELGCLPRHIDLRALTGDTGLSLENNLRHQQAVYHKSCSLQFNSNMVQRAEKKCHDKENVSPAPVRSARSSLPVCPTYQEEKCIFCDKCGSRLHPLSRCTTDSGAKQILEAAAALNISKILLLEATKPLKGHAKYHLKCRTEFMNQIRPRAGDVRRAEHQQAEGLVLAGMLSFMQEERDESGKPLVWKMADVNRTYASEMSALGVPCDAHSTRLREQLLEMCPDLESTGTAGQNVMLAFKKDIHSDIAADCRRDFDEEAFYFSRAAEIVRADLFEKGSLLSLKAMIRMVMRSCGQPSDETGDEDRFVNTIADLMAFHATKRGGSSKSRRHRQERETPTAVYVATKLFGETRKRNLVEAFHGMGLCISYKRLNTILEEKAEASAALYRKQDLVCPMSLLRNVFTTVSVDNIDHNTSSTTAMGSFHGTAICVSQHPTPDYPGEPRVVDAVLTESRLPWPNRFDLPDRYSVVKVSFLDPKKASPKCLPSALPVLATGDSAAAYDGEREWLESCRTEETCTRWAVFHAKEDLHRPQSERYKTHTVVLPLFHEKANTVSMMAHAMEIAASTTAHLNPGQTPALVGDQPLFALMKSIQWLDSAYAEDKFFVMMGGLHIEMTAMRICGQWMSGSGWEEMLVEAGIAEQGSAEAMTHDSNHNKTRYAHQATAAALYALMVEAFDCAASSDDPVNFDGWRKEMREKSAQFRYWDISLSLELVAMELSRSIRLGDFELYKLALSKLVSWCFSLDHPNYARWLPVHMRDLESLQTMHPDLYDHFQAGHFVGRLSGREGSGVAWDHLHENMNKDLKGNGGMIGLTEQRGKLRKHCLVTPHLAEMNTAFEVREKPSRHADTRHHQDSEKKRKDFQRHVSSLTEAFRSAANPFMDDGTELYNLYSGTICSEKVKETVFRVEELGVSQYNTYAEQRMNSGNVSIHDPIKQNRLPLFSTKQFAQPRIKAQVKSLKENCKLFGALFASADDEDEPVDKNTFFSHEIENYPPSLSLHGAMRSTTKSDLLQCLMDGVVMPDCNPSGPTVDAKILDGAAIVHMLNPGGCSVFSDYVQVFLSFVRRELELVKRVDIVWDRYDKDSLKVWTRIKRGEGVRRRVTPTSKVPVKGWKNFLREDENKKDLFCLLADGVQGVLTNEKSLCSTRGEEVVFAQHTAPAGAESAARLGPCNHEEADTRIMVHVAEAVRLGHTRVLIRTVDTDVVVIAISSFEKFGSELDELWVHIKAGKNSRFFPVHTIVTTLGPKKSVGLIGFHAFTGCDTVSSFYGIGKIKAWNALKSMPEAVDAFILLKDGKIDEARPLLTKFVVSMYCPSEMHPSLTMCRRALHTKNDRPVENLPPTDDTLDGQLKRASLASETWDQALCLTQHLPSPAERGWKKDDGLWKPVWKTTPVASKVVQSLLRCKCKKSCTGNCTCTKNGKSCGARCKCSCDSAKLL